MRSGTHGLMSVSGAADSSSPSWAAASVSESAAMLPAQQNTTSTQTHQQFMGGDTSSPSWAAGSNSQSVTSKQAYNCTSTERTHLSRAHSAQNRIYERAKITCKVPILSNSYCSTHSYRIVSISSQLTVSALNA